VQGAVGFGNSSDLAQYNSNVSSYGGVNYNSTIRPFPMMDDVGTMFAIKQGRLVNWY